MQQTSKKQTHILTTLKCKIYIQQYNTGVEANVFANSAAASCAAFLSLDRIPIATVGEAPFELALEINETMGTIVVLFVGSIELEMIGEDARWIMVMA